jgi:hypothetical protein
MSTAFHDALLPTEWFAHDQQAIMFKANLKYPCYGDAFENATHNEGVVPVYLRAVSSGKEPVHAIYNVPSFSKETLAAVTNSSALGDPLHREDRDKLCLLFTPTLPRFSFEKGIYGEATEDGVVPGSLPADFPEQCNEAQCAAHRVLREHTSEPYHVMGTKLNQLGSGACNIVVYLKFPSGCPFQDQRYLESEHLFSQSVRAPRGGGSRGGGGGGGGRSRGAVRAGGAPVKVRIVPHPIVLKHHVDAVGLRLVFKFFGADMRKLYNRLYAFLRNIVVGDLRMFLRFIRARGDTIDVVAQYDEHTPGEEELKKILEDLPKRRKLKTAFSPDVLVDFSWETTPL